MPRSMAATTVVYVYRRDAKAIKTWLEQSSYLDKRFRMSPVVDVVRAMVADNDDGNEKGGSDDCSISIASSDDIITTRLRWHNNSIDSKNDNECDSEDGITKDCIAVPVIDAFLCKLAELFRRHLHHDEFISHEDDNELEHDEWDVENYCKAIVGFGRYKCPFSTAMLGNQKKNRNRHFYGCVMQPTYGNDATAAATHSGVITSSSSGIAEGTPNVAALPSLTIVQHVLIDTLTHWQQTIWQGDCDNPNNKNITNNNDNNDHCVDRLNIERLVRQLSYQTCPKKKLEIIGDDRTLVIPHRAFFVTNNSSSSSSIKTMPNASTVNTISNGHSCEFRDLLANVIHECQTKFGRNICRKTQNRVDDDDNDVVLFLGIQSQLWERFATVYQCTRIVRRGEIDSNSGTRESGHRILWPPALESGSAGEDDIASNDDNDNDDKDKWLCYNNTNYGYVPKMTGPNSPGWITVTEHGIHQSYDMSRVMFSRGNVTEKARFGKLCVQPNENVLDMYAGIGYYTLPAFIHGKARHVTACEWNVHAIRALRYNLFANGIDEDRVTILEGDCRANLERLLQEKVNANDDEFGYDRISLGLLPTSEGGWAVAVSCLHRRLGGWLHVHANVPTRERHQWTCWLGQSLANIASIIQRRRRQRRRLHLQSNKFLTECCIAIDKNDDNADEEDDLAGIDSNNNIGNESNDSDEWIAVVHHVERVKSFAPLIDHLVADVFVGPCHSSKAPSSVNSVFESSSRRFMPNLNCTTQTQQPTCALNKDGVLHQHWLQG